MSNINKMEAAGTLAISALQIVKANGSLSDAQLAVIEEALNAMFDAKPVWHSHPRSTPESGDVERVAKAAAFAVRHHLDCARDENHYWENLGAQTQGKELIRARAAIAAMNRDQAAPSRRIKILSKTASDGEAAIIGTASATSDHADGLPVEATEKVTPSLEFEHEDFAEAADSLQDAIIYLQEKLNAGEGVYESQWIGPAIRAHEILCALSQQSGDYLDASSHSSVGVKKDLAAENAELREALVFYADPETYAAIGFFPDAPCGEFIEDFDENYAHDFLEGPRPGKRARALLSRTKDDEQAFDEKIERDAKAGKLDKLEEKAIENYKAGRTHEL